MALSRIANLLADEIRLQDWSDAPYRLDGARHDRSVDRKSANTPVLDDDDAESVRLNVVWVVAQALREDDPGFDVDEFAEASGVPKSFRITSRGAINGMIAAGVRLRQPGRRFHFLQQDERHWIKASGYPSGGIGGSLRLSRDVLMVGDEIAHHGGVFRVTSVERRSDASHGFEAEDVFPRA